MPGQMNQLNMRARNGMQLPQNLQKTVLQNQTNLYGPFVYIYSANKRWRDMLIVCLLQKPSADGQPSTETANANDGADD